MSGISRRTFARLGALALAPGVALGAAADPLVQTSNGPIRGRREDGINVFKGIPYGAPTGGENRFRRPRNPLPWQDPLEALDYGPAAPQPASPLFQDARMDEDCLVINVWTPGLGDGGDRPIMLWLHGGGFSTLSGSSPMYDGTNLCQRGDVVVITLNHRLNVFGFLHLADIAGGEFNGAGNLGMLDIAHALQWVRQNARRFGGDPGNVTIFGESGGGRKTSTLMGMPDARGLFHRAIIQSGPGLHLQPRDKASEVAAAFLEALKLSPNDAAKLRELSVERLLAAHDAVAAGFDDAARLKGRFEQRGFVPTVGVPELPVYAFDPVASPLSAQVPLLIGSNRHEMALFLRGDPKIYDQTLTEADLAERVALIVGNARDRVLETYARQYPQTSPAERWVLITTDRTYRADSITLAQRKAMQGPATFMYYFTWQSRTDPKLLSHHGLEIPFAFDNLDRTPWTSTEPASQALAARMSEAWIAFARSGNPNAPALPSWPEYDPAQRATMVLDAECRVANDPDAAVRHLWATL
ncbi:MAG: carboxylesterase/lipase family protein [Pseudomonadales bacterium]